MKKIKFVYKWQQFKVDEVVEINEKSAQHYINTGIAMEVNDCDDCKKGNKGCKDCGDTEVINDPKEEIKEPIKRTRKSSKK